MMFDVPDSFEKGMNRISMIVDFFGPCDSNFLVRPMVAMILYVVDSSNLATLQ